MVTIASLHVRRRSFRSSCEHAKWEEREGIYGRNYVLRRKTFFGLGANKFNDQAFKPYSFCYPDLHDDFIVSIPLFDNENCTLPLVTPNKIKVQLSACRCKLRMKTL